MAKLIFTSRYIRDVPPEHLQNYVRYISTREGVEKVDESKKNLPVTPAQKDLIRQLIIWMPAKDTFIMPCRTFSEGRHKGMGMVKGTISKKLSFLLLFICLVGAHFPEYDGYLVLSHFKGHAMAGFGGAIKNISIGLGSQEGKCLIHTAGESHTSPWGGEQDPFTESMAEAGKSVVDALDGNILYISVMNRLSIDCDCDGNPSEPDMHDIGILASTDPVALDQACVDLVYASQDDTASLIQRMESRNAIHVLEHGEEIGLGSRSYQLVSIDD